MPSISTPSGSSIHFTAGEFRAAAEAYVRGSDRRETAPHEVVEWARLAKIAASADCSVKTVQRALAKSRRAGLVTWSRGGQGRGCKRLWDCRRAKPFFLWQKSTQKSTQTPPSKEVCRTSFVKPPEPARPVRRARKASPPSPRSRRAAGAGEERAQRGEMPDIPPAAIERPEDLERLQAALVDAGRAETGREDLERLAAHAVAAKRIAKRSRGDAVGIFRARLWHRRERDAWLSDDDRAEGRRWLRRAELEREAEERRRREAEERRHAAATAPAPRQLTARERRELVAAADRRRQRHTSPADVEARRRQLLTFARGGPRASTHVGGPSHATRDTVRPHPAAVDPGAGPGAAAAPPEGPRDRAAIDERRRKKIPHAAGRQGLGAQRPWLVYGAFGCGAPRLTTTHKPPTAHAAGSPGTVPGDGRGAFDTPESIE